MPAHRHRPDDKHRRRPVHSPSPWTRIGIGPGLRITNARRVKMQRLLCGLAGCALTLLLGSAAADAEDTAKIGLIMSYSGQFADTATQMDNGIKLYMKQHGD